MLRFFVLILITFLAYSACHPSINKNYSQYIVGYGSLMDESSKQRTDKTTTEGVPIFLKGYQRGWFVHGTLPGLNATFLSIKESPYSSLNGVIYKLINPNNIAMYDKRERIYCRKELSTSKIKFYSSIPTENKQIWIYVPKNKYTEKPEQNYPIVQSYVDIFIRGCINIEGKFNIPDFAKNCVNSTTNWSIHWVNDRIFPRRPL